MKIVVCGNSFCSADTSKNRYHFSQRLADQYGHEVINLAHGGVTTTAICFQMQTAITLKPNVIIYNQSSPDRVDLVLKDNYFNVTHGLKNFIYAYPNNESYGSPHVGAADAPIFPTVWQGIRDQQHVPITDRQEQAIKSYLTHLFDWGLKKETDRWMIGYWRQQIVNAGIHPIEVSAANPATGVLYEFAHHNPNYPALYHTDPETQQKVADRLHQEFENV